MAKKKSKANMTKLILGIIIIALAVLTICTLFMPVFTSTLKTALTTSSSSVKGTDVITACFKGEVSSDLTSGANSLISLKNSDDAGFVTTVFCWTYFITVLVSAAVVVFAILSMVGLNFKLTNTILGACLVLLALLAMIFGFVTAGKFGAVDLGSLMQGKTTASAAVWLMLGAMATGGLNVYKARS